MTLVSRRLSFLLAVCCLAAPWGAAWAQAAAGRFLAVTGEVTVVATDGARRAATQGSDIQSGETLITGASSLAQLRMADSSLFSVRADSEFKLDQFSYGGKNDTNASFVVSVLKGGFRTITGLVAQLNRRNYRINTPSATIGVRGTHFEVVHVLPQIAAPDAPAGTYNRVYEGITTLQNPAGAQLLVNREQTAFAALQAGAAPVLVAPPSAIFGNPTPVPRAAAAPAAPQGPTRAASKGGPRADPQPTVRGIRPGSPIVREGAPTLRSPTTTSIAPTLTPLEPTTTLRTLEPSTTLISPTTTTISPTLTPLEPTTTLRTLDTTTTTISPTTTTILQSPTTSTILQSPTTSTILQSPTTTTTIAPKTTTISPTTTTTSPTLLQSPTTTTIRR